MTTPAVTIGVSCHNSEKYLPALFASIEAQTFRDWEVIAVDDGSTDGSLRILKSFEGPKVTVLSDGKNLGLGARLNQIHRSARGVLVARTDADDVLHPKRLERQVNTMLADPSVDVCATLAYCMGSSGALRGMRSIPEVATTAREVMFRNGPSHPTIMAKREWFIRYPYCTSPKRGQDLDLWIRSIETSKLCVIPEALHFIREDGAFDVQKYRRSMADHRAIFRRHLSWNNHPLLLCQLLALTYIKQWAYRGADLLGVLSAVSSRRIVPLDAKSAGAIETHRWLYQLMSEMEQHS